MIYDKLYIRADDRGTMRVGQTRVSLDSVVIAYRAGHSPETIREQYPALSLEEVHGAIAFYLANQREVDEYLERQDKLWDEARRKAEEQPSAVVDRLRGIKSTTLAEKT